MISRILHKFSSLGRIRHFDNPFQIIVSHLLYPKGKILYVWKGKSILVDGTRAETSGGIHAVLTTEEYTQFLDLIDRSSVRNLMDLGPNVGSFTLLANHYFPGLKRSVLVEGDASVVPRLEFNIYGNLTKAKAQVIYSAVCGHDGEVTFYQNPTSVGSGTTADSAGDGAVATTVPAISISTILRQFPEEETIDVCKMDIEGSEYAAIYALSSQELGRINCIIVELHASDEENEKFISHLKGSGFTHKSGGPGGNERTHAFFRNPAAVV